MPKATLRRLLVLGLSLFLYSLWHCNLRFAKIVIHCTDSPYANRDLIHMWHQDRGWSEIGYNFVILNGRPLPQIQRPSEDGSLQKGRSLLRDGAHARGDNRDSIGVVLVGVNQFTGRQMETLMKTIRLLMTQYNIAADRVVGHYELQSGILQKKTCPNIDMNQLRQLIREEENGHRL